MIEIDYAMVVGNNLSIGNRMFQYSFGRILAEEKNWALSCPPIRNFPRTEESVPGRRVVEPKVSIQGHVVNFQGLLRLRAAKIVLTQDAYLQRYEYYRAYKERIRRWFAPVSSVAVTNRKDLVVHLRLGDYAKSGEAIPYAYLNEIIDQIEFDRLWIVTDEPDGIDRAQIRASGRIHSIVSNPDWFEDLKLIAGFDKILLTGSTFAWWAAWLSEAREVHFPIIENGFWSFRRKDIDLCVDEKRYRYYVEGRRGPLSYRQMRSLRRRRHWTDWWKGFRNGGRR